MAQQADTFEPSGSNDELFHRTMAGIEQRHRSRSESYRRRFLGATVTICGFATAILLALESLLNH